jgi:holo-[acyl-carrier protein] synthase
MLHKNTLMTLIHWSAATDAPLHADVNSRRTRCGKLTAIGMIVGTGIDIVEVPRVAATLKRFGERFVKRVFTDAEIRYCDSKLNRAERYAARFAAKEAGLKAIGTGLSGGISWRDVEVARQPGGRPALNLHGKAAAYAARLGARRTSLSLSHTAQHAIAQVILED